MVTCYSLYRKGVNNLNRKNNDFFFPILLILLALVPSNGFASEFNFAVTPIPSEKQVDKEKLTLIYY